MSKQYDDYLKKHKDNVKKGFDWMKENLPTIINPIMEENDLEWQLGFSHDWWKSNQKEYDAYDAYYYGNNKSFAVVQNYQLARLEHIHQCQHHWQYWILLNDETEGGITIIDIPVNYIVEMICDWWSFSWEANDLTTMFNWYDEHTKNIQFSDKTRKRVESLLDLMKEVLEQKKEEQ